MKTNGNGNNQTPMNAAKFNRNGANMEQIEKRKIAKVLISKTLVILLMS